MMRRQRDELMNNTDQSRMGDMGNQNVKKHTADQPNAELQKLKAKNQALFQEVGKPQFTQT